MKNVACILLAGGIGERLSPISSHHHPKFLLKVNGKFLIEMAYERALRICGKENTYIISTKSLKDKILQALQDFREENFIEEPQRKNTLPAFITSLLNTPPKRNALVFFPCDHIIENGKEFFSTVNKGIEVARSGFLTLIGIKPTEPSSHYGYIIPDKKIAPKCFLVKGFEEKPERKRAELLIKKGALWNSGIYLVSREKLKILLSTHQKEIWEKFEREKEIEKVYEELTSLSFDKGVTEKESHRAVIKGNFFWCDIGTIQSIIKSIKERNDIITGGEVYVEDCKRVLAVSWEKPLFMSEICDIMVLINGEKVEIRGVKNGRKRK